MALINKRWLTRATVLLTFMARGAAAPLIVCRFPSAADGWDKLEASRSYTGHMLMENRNGIPINGCVTGEKP
jgi:hypothetical protein